MSGLAIFGLLILGVFIISFSVFLIKSRLRRNEYADWEINDSLILDDFIFNSELKKNGKEYAKLKGWNDNNLYITIGNDKVYKVDWGVLKSNKSALWRRNLKECEMAMGKKPAFSDKIDDDDDITYIDNNDTVDGKSIILLTEVECEVYLKHAIETENYELANKIRKQMEKYR